MGWGTSNNYATKECKLIFIAAFVWKWQSFEALKALHDKLAMLNSWNENAFKKTKRVHLYVVGQINIGQLKIQHHRFGHMLSTLSNTFNL